MENMILFDMGGMGCQKTRKNAEVLYGQPLITSAARDNTDVS